MNLFLYMCEKVVLFPQYYWRGCLFPTVYSCPLCCRLIAHVSAVSFLGSLSWCIDLCICCGARATVFFTVDICYSLKSGSMIPPASFFFLRLSCYFGVFCVSIHTLQLLVLVLWNIPSIFWRLCWMCRFLWEVIIFQ